MERLYVDVEHITSTEVRINWSKLETSEDIDQFRVSLWGSLVITKVYQVFFSLCFDTQSISSLASSLLYIMHKE